MSFFAYDRDRTMNSYEEQLAMELVIQLIVIGVCAVACAGVAPNRGRSAFNWFLIGGCTGCIGLIVLLCLPDLKEEERKLKEMRKQHRRLKETALKDRHVADQRHAQVTRRLGQHDEALGISTAHSLTDGAGSGESKLLGGPPPLNVWHYARDDTQHGPFGIEQIRRLLNEGQITTDTLVWRQGMPGWQKLGQTAEFESEES